MDTSKIFRALHTALAEYLRDRLKSGEGVTAAEIEQARKFLADNGVEDGGRAGSPSDAIVGELPFAEDPEISA